MRERIFPQLRVRSFFASVFFCTLPSPRKKVLKRTYVLVLYRRVRLFPATRCHFPPFFLCTLSFFWRRLAGELSSFPASYLRAAAAPLLRERREVALSDDISITNFLRGRRRSRRWNKRRRKSVEILRRRCHFSHLSSPATCRIYSYSCFLKSPDESLEGRARATLLFQQTQHYYCRKRGRTEDLVAEEEAALSFLPFLSALSRKKRETRNGEREREGGGKERRVERGGKTLHLPFFFSLPSLGLLRGGGGGRRLRRWARVTVR